MRRREVPGLHVKQHRVLCSNCLPRFEQGEAGCSGLALPRAVPGCPSIAVTAGWCGMQLEIAPAIGPPRNSPSYTSCQCGSAWRCSSSAKLKVEAVQISTGSSTGPTFHVSIPHSRPGEFVPLEAV